MARIARLFRPLPPLARGIAAMATVMGGALGVVAAIALVVHSRYR